MFDATGYSKPSWVDALKSRNYQITYVQLDNSKTKLNATANQIDELLEMDLVRLSNTILNKNLSTEFKLKLEAKTIYNYDSV